MVQVPKAGTPRYPLNATVSYAINFLKRAMDENPMPLTSLKRASDENPMPPTSLKRA